MSPGVANPGFNQDATGVSPERLRDDLEAQRRYRDRATPILAQRVTIEPRESRSESRLDSADGVTAASSRRASAGSPGRPRLGDSIGSFYSVDDTEKSGMKHGGAYLELNEIPMEVSGPGIL